MSLQISTDGQFFELTCEHCQLVRREPVDPERNRFPFEFLMHCSCGRRLDYDPEFVLAAQESYSRAKWGRD